MQMDGLLEWGEGRRAQEMGGRRAQVNDMVRSGLFLHLQYWIVLTSSIHHQASFQQAAAALRPGRTH